MKRQTIFTTHALVVLLTVVLLVPPTAHAEFRTLAEYANGES